MRIGRRLFGSTVLGCAAGLLLTLDGFHLVLSRTALLDIFLLLFVLATFGALLVDRDARRRRWLAALEAGGAATVGRALVAVARHRAVRLLAVDQVERAVLPAGLPAADVLVGRGRAPLGRRPAARGARPSPPKDGGSSRTPPSCLAVYLATWSGWLLTDDGFYRHWLADNGRAEPPVIGALQNLFHYHHEAFKFHSTLQAGHQNQSWPWQWLLLGQPVAFYLDYAQGQWGTAPVSEVLLLGTPLLWWSFLPALLATLLARCRPARLAGRRDPARHVRRHAAVVLLRGGRPPHDVLVLHGPGPAVHGVRGGLRARRADRRTRRHTARLTGASSRRAYVVLVTLCFAYFYRLFVGEPMAYADWAARMWLGSRWHP